MTFSGGRAGPRAISVGRVGRPHGLDGSFYVTGASPDLPRNGFVRLGEERREIMRRAGTDERPILRLSGLSSRADAEALRGAELRAEVALAADEYWAHDLEGCAVVDGGRPVGFVRRMTALPSCEVLEVDRPDGSELLVPLVRDAIRSIDVAARRIDVDLGFLGER
jgi:16S rRNA processing protein RimM